LEPITKLPIDISQIYKTRFYRNDYWNAAYSELVSVKQSADQVKVASTPLSMPLIVLTAARPPEILQKLQFPVEDYIAIWMQLQKELVKLSPNAKHVVIEDSGHYINLDRPDVVVKAIQQAIEMTR
jgi:pimeloyl-ACP methyl ester carboxylesterase